MARLADCFFRGSLVRHVNRDTDIMDAAAFVFSTFNRPVVARLLVLSGLTARLLVKYSLIAVTVAILPTAVVSVVIAHLRLLAYLIKVVLVADTQMLHSP